MGFPMEGTDSGVSLRSPLRALSGLINEHGEAGFHVDFGAVLDPDVAAITVAIRTEIARQDVFSRAEKSAYTDRKGATSPVNRVFIVRGEKAFASRAR